MATADRMAQKKARKPQRMVRVNRGAEGPKRSTKVSAARRLKKKTYKTSVKKTTPISRARVAKKASEGPKKSTYTYAMSLGKGRGKEGFANSGPVGRKKPGKGTGISEWKEYRGGRPRGTVRSYTGSEGPKRSIRRKKK